MSMGAYDYVPRLLREADVDLRITKIRIKPGKPFVFGVRDEDGKPAFVFGLPGNPVSGFVCTVRFASRLLTRMAGGQVIERWATGRLDAGLPPNGPREFYQPVLRSVPSGSTSAHNEMATVSPLLWKGSADLFTLAAANALLVRAENDPAVPKGTMVRVLEI
jgi:molybdopterin molybdotransferase